MVLYVVTDLHFKSEDEVYLFTDIAVSLGFM